VSTFLDNARSIFEAAESAALSGHAASHLTIVVGDDGAIRMIADSDWPLDRVLAHNGGRMAYRVSEQAGRLRVEGCSAGAVCRMEADTPRSAPRRLAALASPIPLPGPGAIPASRQPRFPQEAAAVPYAIPASRRNLAASSGGVGLM
jgi:hypothetical protein